MSNQSELIEKVVDEIVKLEKEKIQKKVQSTSRNTSLRADSDAVNHIISIVKDIIKE